MLVCMVGSCNPSLPLKKNKLCITLLKKEAFLLEQLCLNREQHVRPDTMPMIKTLVLRHHDWFRY